MKRNFLSGRRNPVQLRTPATKSSAEKKHSIESYRVGTVWTGLYRVAPWGNGFWPGSNKMESGRPIKSFGEATARSRIGPKKKRKEKFPRRSSGPLAASRACSVSSFLFVPDFFVVFFCFFFSCYLRVEVGFIHSVMTLTRGDGQNYLRFIARDGPPSSSSSSTSSSSSSFLSLQNSVNSRRQNPVTDRHSVHTVRFRSSSRPRRFCVAFDFDLFDWLVGLFVCLFFLSPRSSRILTNGTSTGHSAPTVDSNWRRSAPASLTLERTSPPPSPPPSRGPPAHPRHPLARSLPRRWRRTPPTSSFFFVSVFFCLLPSCTLKDEDGGENVVELGRVAGDSMKCELFFFCLFFRSSKPESGLMCPESRFSVTVVAFTEKNALRQVDFCVIWRLSTIRFATSGSPMVGVRTRFTHYV